MSRKVCVKEVLSSLTIWIYNEAVIPEPLVLVPLKQSPRHPPYSGELVILEPLVLVPLKLQICREHRA